MSIKLIELEGTMEQRLINAGLNLGFKETLLCNIFCPIETITGNIPVTLRDNSGNHDLQTFRFARIVFNPLGGDKLSQGGLKITEGILPGGNTTNLEELARMMALKHYFTGTGYAGAKAAVEVPKSLIQVPGLLDTILYKLGRDFLCQVLHPQKGGIGPDTNTGNGKTDRIVNGLTRVENDGRLPGWNIKDARAAVTGKSPENGGLILREESTGIGVALAAKRLIHSIKNKFSNFMEKIGIQGTGAVGLATMKQLIIQGFNVTAFSTLGTDNLPYTVICQEGFTIDHLELIKYGRFQVESAIKFDNIQIIIGGENLFGPKINFLIPCAAENIITSENLKSIPGLAGIVEGANSPLTIEAACYVNYAKIQIESGETANSLGVYMSVLERKAAFEGYMPTVEEQMKHLLEGRANIERMIDEASKNFPGVSTSSALVYSFVQAAATQRTNAMSKSRHIIQI